MYKLFIVVLAVSVNSVFCANILYASSLPSPSHHIWNGIYAMGLAQKGHNVTLIDPDVNRLPKHKNFTHICMEGIYEKLNDDFDLNAMIKYGALEMVLVVQDWSVFGCKAALQTQGLKKLLNYPPDFKFDLVIIDVTSSSCLYPLIHRFNYPPSIGVTGFLLPSFVSYNFGNYIYPTLVPFYGLPYAAKMNFPQRLWNTLYTYADVFLRYKRQYLQEHNAAKQLFGTDIPSMEVFERHISLILANTDPVLDHPQPLSPNFISVGGLHTRESEKLPKDLQTLLDNATNGVIVFSLGTNIRSDKLGESAQKALLGAFSKISETVIWKFESDIENLPKNVIIRKWLPQNNILGHRNVKLFIGHGGALSTQEAIFHGVPMICFPFIIDQHINTKVIVNKNMGLYLEYHRITEDYVLQLIREVLDNPIYSQNIKKLSSTYKDRMVTPLEKAVFWAEYVIRHGGADFLSSPARDMAFYQVYGLDILLFLSLIIILACFLIYKIIRLLLNLCTGKQKLKTS